MGFVWVYMQKMELHYLWEYGDWRYMAFVDTVEISGGCKKIVPVSESFWSNLMFLRMIDLTAWF